MPIIAGDVSVVVIRPGRGGGGGIPQTAHHGRSLGGLHCICITIEQGLFHREMAPIVDGKGGSLLYMVAFWLTTKIGNKIVLEQEIGWFCTNGALTRRLSRDDHSSDPEASTLK